MTKVTATDKPLTARAHADAILKHLRGNRDRKLNAPKPGLSIYEPQPTDVIVTTFPKAGTTLMQQLVYQVVVQTGGSPSDDTDGTNFTDISERVPIVGLLTKADLAKPQPSPRVFKTHAHADRFRIGCQRHVVVIRDPCRFPGSWLDFVCDLFPAAVLDAADARVRELVFRDTVRDVLFDTSRRGDVATNLGTWFQHTRDWLALAARNDVLVLFYEDVVADVAASARRVARFLGRELSEDGLAVVVRRCGRDYMAAAAGQFDSRWDAERMGVEAAAPKVRPVGREGYTEIRFTDGELEEIAKVMNEMFGVPSYEELRKRVTADQTI